LVIANSLARDPKFTERVGPMTALLQVRTGTGLLPFRAQVVIGAGGFPSRYLFASSLKAVHRSAPCTAAVSTSVIHAMLAVAAELASGR
jgi:hypothetical protein